MQSPHRLLLSTILGTAGIVGASIYANAQDASDVLRYSYQSPQGTARSIGFGGALGSIGGDFGSVSVNPAGIGVYRNSEFMFTPAIKLNNVSGSYMGNNSSDNNTRFSFNNIGVVFTSAAKGRRYQRSDWKSVSFGFGINRIADFNRNYVYSGTNSGAGSSSASELFALDANQFPEDIGNPATLAGLGYQSFLVDSFGGNAFQTVVPWQTGIIQRRIVQERGGISDMSISLGGNYREKLMLGATIGLPIINYNHDVTYEETDATNDPDNYFDNFSFKESLSTSGLGINLKLGFIYKPDDAFRFGAAFHTPTYYGMSDEQSRTITTNTEDLKAILGYTGGPITTVNADLQSFNYNILTPWKGVLSASGIFGKYGFITADVEYVNYKSMRFNFEPFFAQAEANINNFIKNNYKGAANVRIGGEVRFDMIMFRLGFGYYGSPYETSFANADRLDASAGVGFRHNSFFADLGFVRSMYNQQEQPYNLDAVNEAYNANIVVPTATLKNALNTVAFTVGWKF